MGLFSRSPQPRTPSEEEVRSAARQLQQGGIRGRGSSRLADRLVGEAVDGQATATQILSAAAEYEPRH
jgi:hypothetical protein